MFIKKYSLQAVKNDHVLCQQKVHVCHPQLVIPMVLVDQDDRYYLLIDYNKQEVLFIFVLMIFHYLISLYIKDNKYLWSKVTGPYNYNVNFYDQNFLDYKTTTGLQRLKVKI
jgi:hypothetical protein